MANKMQNEKAVEKGASAITWTKMRGVEPLSEGKRADGCEKKKVPLNGHLAKAMGEMKRRGAVLAIWKIRSDSYLHGMKIAKIAVEMKMTYNVVEKLAENPADLQAAKAALSEMASCGLAKVDFRARLEEIAKGGRFARDAINALNLGSEDRHLAVMNFFSAEFRRELTCAHEQENEIAGLLEAKEEGLGKCFSAIVGIRKADGEYDLVWMLLSNQDRQIMDSLGLTQSNFRLKLRDKGAEGIAKKALWQKNENWKRVLGLLRLVEAAIGEPPQGGDEEIAAAVEKKKSGKRKNMNAPNKGAAAHLGRNRPPDEPGRIEDIDALLGIDGCNFAPDEYDDY